VIASTNNDFKDFEDVDSDVMTIGKSTRLVPLPLPPVSTKTGFDASNSFKHHDNPASDNELAEYLVQEYLLRILNYKMIVDKFAWEDLFCGLSRMQMEVYGVHLVHDLAGAWLSRIERLVASTSPSSASSSSSSSIIAASSSIEVLQLLRHVQHCLDSLDLSGLGQMLVASRAQETYVLKTTEPGATVFNTSQVINRMTERMLKLDEYLKHRPDTVDSATTALTSAPPPTVLSTSNNRETILPYKLHPYLGDAVQSDKHQDRGLKMDLLLVLKNARSD
jgi:hypothetical protein